MNKPSNLRRYPALAYLIAAGALALLLPSALTLPRSGPQTLAEYAPVPGDSEGASDVSELGSTTSKGTGFGDGKPLDSLEDPAPLSGKQRFELRAGIKRCVGDPPRQTEDPLSPPCIAFFEGDNGGATAKGVTPDEVRVVVELERTSTDPKAGELVDCADPVDDEDTQQDITCKAYMRYFNERFQTYNRTVHLWSHHALKPEDLISRINPFAAGASGPDSGFARREVLSFGYLGGSRASYSKYAPYYISYRPDIEDQTSIAASWICTELKDQPARYSGSPLDREQQRVWGWWGDSGPYRDLLLKKLEDCGIVIPENRRAEGVDPRSGNAARLRSNGVTSILIRVGNTSHALTTNEATQLGWFPEWILPGEPGQRGLDGNFYGRLANQSQWQNMFGITFDYRRDGIDEQAWYRAYREGCPDCPRPAATSGGSNTPYAYDMLMLLFQGIQSSGPKLTADNIDRGLHSLPKNGSPSPYKPAAYFDPGNWTFLKDAMRIWWDPSGQPPGSGNTGCYRLPEGGRRYRAGEWTPNDTLAKAAGPCQADAF